MKYSSTPPFELPIYYRAHKRGQTAEEREAIGKGEVDEMEESSGEVAYDPAAAASSASSFATPIGVVGSGGRGRGRGRGRGGGGIAIEGIAELDASLGRPPTAGAGRGADGAPPPPAGGGKPMPKKESKDFRGPDGLFKKADWTCTACGNVNWERRQTCNKCQNQKPNLVTTDEVH